MKHETPRHENTNLVGFIRSKGMERHMLKGHRHRDVCLANLVLRGVRGLKRWQSKRVVWQVHGRCKGVVAEGELLSPDNRTLESAGNNSVDKLRAPAGLTGASMTAKHFHHGYRETMIASDGSRLCLRLIRPTDKSKLLLGFQRLSAESRYRRFFGNKPDLTPDDLRYFTEFDGFNHAALGAFELNEFDEEGAVVGVARFIRLKEDAATAEFSLAVADDQQSKGIGRQLLERLLAIAAERGITQFHGYLLQENKRMMRFLDRVSRDLTVRHEDGMLKVIFPLQPFGGGKAKSALVGLASK